MAGTRARDNFTPMKMKKLMTIKNKMLIGSAVLMLAAMPALATDDTNGESLELYPANQLSVDAFGTISEGEYTINHISGDNVKNGARGGVGAGVTYFITKYIGIGADGYSENTSGSFIDNLSGNLYLRVPLGQSGFAPYVYGGGGYQFDSLKAGFAQAGAGIEFRFTPHIGLFTDARYVVPDKSKFFGVGRAGLRFAF
jgi:Outer membrane protein beta-barrel domain